MFAGMIKSIESAREARTIENNGKLEGICVIDIADATPETSDSQKIGLKRDLVIY